MSEGGDLAVPKTAVLCKIKRCDAVLIATKRVLEKIIKKEAQQPFGLSFLSEEIKNIFLQKKPSL